MVIRTLQIDLQRHQTFVFQMETSLDVLMQNFIQLIFPEICMQCSQNSDKYFRSNSNLELSTKSVKLLRRIY